MSSAIRPEGITHPSIDALLEKSDSKYSLVIYASKRARQINNYHHQLGEGIEKQATDFAAEVAAAAGQA